MPQLVHGPVRCVNYNVGANVGFYVDLRICQRSENLRGNFGQKKKHRKYTLTSALASKGGPFKK